MNQRLFIRLPCGWSAAVELQWNDVVMLLAEESLERLTRHHQEVCAQCTTSTLRVSEFQERRDP